MTQIMIKTPTPQSPDSCTNTLSVAYGGQPGRIRTPHRTLDLMKQQEIRRTKRTSLQALKDKVKTAKRLRAPSSSRREALALVKKPKTRIALLTDWSRSKVVWTNSTGHIRLRWSLSRSKNSTRLWRTSCWAKPKTRPSGARALLKMNATKSDYAWKKCSYNNGIR